MSPLGQAVADRLRAQEGAEGAAALWQRLWEAYATGGVAAVGELLDAMLEPPDGEDG